MVRLRAEARTRSVLAATTLFTLTSTSYAAILSSPSATGAVVVPDTSSSGKAQVTPPPVFAMPITPARASDFALRRRQVASDADMELTCGANFVRCDMIYCCLAGQTCRLQLGTWQCMAPGFGDSNSGGVTYPDLSSILQSASNLVNSMYSSLLDNPFYSSYINSPEFTSIFRDYGGNPASLSDFLDSLTANTSPRTGDRTSLVIARPTNTGLNSNGGNDDNEEDFNNDNVNGDSNNDTEKKSGLSGAAIGGIVAGVILVLATIAGIIFCNRRSKRKNKPAVIPPHPIPGMQHAVYQPPPPPPGGEGNYYAKPPLGENKIPGTPDTRPVSSVVVPQYTPPSVPATEVEATPWAAGIAAAQHQQQQNQQQSTVPYPTHAVETEARPWSQQPTPNLAPTNTSTSGQTPLSPVSPNLSAVGVAAAGQGTGTMGSNTGTTVSAVSPQLQAQNVPPPPPGPPPPQQQQYMAYQRPQVYEMPGGEEQR